MILISNDSFFDDVTQKATGDDVVVIPTSSGTTGYLNRMITTDMEFIYQMLPSALKYFVKQYNPAADNKEIPKLVQSLGPNTPVYKGSKIINQEQHIARSLATLAGGFYNFNFNLTNVPKFIMLSVCQDLFDNTKNNKYLAAEGDNIIKGRLYETFIKAANQILAAKSRTIEPKVYVAPLFTSRGLSPLTNDSDSPWLINDNYIEEMIAWLGMYEFWYENDVTLYIK